MSLCTVTDCKSYTYAKFAPVLSKLASRTSLEEKSKFAVCTQNSVCLAISAVKIKNVFFIL